jgi:pentatricopeptide repeat protein
MQSLAQNGDKAAVLNLVKYSTCISAWMGISNFVRAANLLHDMTDDYMRGCSSCRPDSKTYNKVIQGLIQCRKVQEADKLVRRMFIFDSKSKDDVASTFVLYRKIIKCWDDAGEPDRAEALVTFISQLQKSGKSKLSAGPGLYKMVIAAWKNSGRRDAPERVRALECKLNQISTSTIQHNSGKRNAKTGR